MLGVRCYTFPYRLFLLPREKKNVSSGCNIRYIARKQNIGCFHFSFCVTQRYVTLKLPYIFQLCFIRVHPRVQGGMCAPAEGALGYAAPHPGMDVCPFVLFLLFSCSAEGAIILGTTGRRAARTVRSSGCCRTSRGSRRRTGCTRRCRSCR